MCIRDSSNRPDLHAFILLDRIFPDTADIVTAAEHDEIYLGISYGQIETLAPETILELYRCGVRYDSSTDSLCMFV